MVVDNKGIISFIRVLKEDLAIFRIKPLEGQVPDFKAGQFVTLGLPVRSENGKIVRRAYSIASPPEQKLGNQSLEGSLQNYLIGKKVMRYYGSNQLVHLVW